MKILVNTSTFKQSLNDPAPNFINKLVENFSEENQFFILYPRKIEKVENKNSIKNITLIPYNYIFPSKFSNLSKYGLYPSIKKNKLNLIKILFLIFFQFINLIYFSIKLKPQIIYSHWVFPQGFISALVGKMLNINTVFTSHGSDVKILNNLGYFGKFIINFTLNNSVKFTAVSKNGLENLKFATPNNSKVFNSEIIPMGVDEIFFTKEKLVSKKLTNTIKFLYFGRFINYKGIDLIIEAAFKLKKVSGVDFKIDLIGTGIEINNIKKQIKDYDLEKFITVINFVEKEELINFIDESDFVIIPSKITKNEYEAGPLSLVEAMARKKICIVSNSIGFIDFINKENAIIFESNSIDDLLNKMIEALSLSNKKRKIIENEAYKLSENFKYRIISKKTEEFLF